MDEMNKYVGYEGRDSYRYLINTGIDQARACGVLKIADRRWKTVVPCSLICFDDRLLSLESFPVTRTSRIEISLHLLHRTEANASAE
jgi:hypothetical protein